MLRHTVFCEILKETDPYSCLAFRSIDCHHGKRTCGDKNPFTKTTTNPVVYLLIHPCKSNGEARSRASQIYDLGQVSHIK